VDKRRRRNEKEIAPMPKTKTAYIAEFKREVLAY
jgi:hypothetical protein